MAPITPVDAVPPGCTIRAANTATAQLKRTNTAITKTKWTGTGPDGKFASGMYALAGGKLLADGGAELERQERLAVWAERGAIDDEAWQHFATLPAAKEQEPLGFFASVRGPEVFCDKVAGPDANCLAAQAAAHKAKIAQVSTPLLAAGGTIEWQDGPFFSGKASPKLLMALRHHPLMASIALEPLSPEPTSLSSVWGDSVVGWSTGVNPVDVRVCLIEGYAPTVTWPWTNGLQIAHVRFPNGLPDVDAHCNQMADILTGTAFPTGLALGAQISVANWNWPDGPSGPSESYPWWTGLTYCRDRLTTVWNFSQRYGSITIYVTNPQQVPYAEDRYFDWLALQAPYPTMLAAAGNFGNAKNVNNKLRNGLVVGGSQERAAQQGSDCSFYVDPSAARSTHTIWGGFGYVEQGDSVGSQGKNPATAHGDWELPHIVAPSTSSCLSISATGKTTGGTSASTAAVSAGVAQIQQVNSALRSWPEACRAIVMATADEDVDGPAIDLTDAVDDLDGAGEINIQGQVTLAESVNRQPAPQVSYAAQGFDYGTFEFNDPANFIPPASGAARTFYHQYRVMSPTTRQIRLVLTWNSASTCADPATCDPIQSLVPDLDMAVVVDQSDQDVARSMSYDSNYEVIQFQALAGVHYRVRLTYFPYSGGTRSWYAIAWAPNAI